MGNVGGRRVRQGYTSPANITNVVEIQSKPLPLTPVCPIRLPFILVSILPFIILWGGAAVKGLNKGPPSCFKLLTFFQGRTDIDGPKKGHIYSVGCHAHAFSEYMTNTPVKTPACIE